MSTVVSGRSSALSHKPITIACLLFTAAWLLTSCSIPNLEEADCRESRGQVREFYSFHFGNDMHLTAENIKLREKYFSRRLVGELLDDVNKQPERSTEYFTAAPTNDLPKAFRVGECKVVEPGKKVQFDVLLFWKDDVRTEQRHVAASLIKENDRWIVDSVSP